MNSTAAICLLVIVFMFGSLECNAKKKELVIGQLGSKKDTCLGTQLAYDVSKNSSDFKAFLETYEIKIHCMPETRNSPSNAIFYAIYLCKDRNGSKPLVILGPDYAEEASAVLNVVRYYLKPMVTILTTTTKMKELKDPYAFTFKETAYSINPAKIEIMKLFQWERAAVVYDFVQDGGFYVKVVEDLAGVAKKEIPSTNLDLTFEPINPNLRTELVKGSVFDVIKKSLQKLRDLDYKIFIGEFNKRGASLVFCELFKMGMYGPDFVWILNPEAGTVEEWVQVAKISKIRLDNNLTTICTKEQYQVAVNRSFLLQGGMARANPDYVFSSGLTERQTLDKLGINITNINRKDKIRAAFDAMWGTMLAMKATSEELRTIDNGTYGLESNNGPRGEPKVTKLVVKKLTNVSFQGLTGPVAFTKDKLKEGVIALKQYQDGGTKLVDVGYFRREERIQFYNGTEKSLWKDNRIPSDRTVKIPVPTDIPAALFIIFSTVASFGIVLGIIFLVFNRYYRKYKFIRLSAPMFNDVMVSGCIMCLSTVYLFGFRDFKHPKITMPRICKARAWILNIGFSLAFGAMFIKTWRIYKICTNKRLKVRLGPLSDWWMLAMVGGIVVIDVAMLVAWEVTDPLQHHTVNLTEKEDPDHPFNRIIISTLNTCTAKNLEVWLALIYVFKGILLLYGLFLAYETRNVVYAHLNDSRVIGICVYNVVVLSTIGAFLALILNDEQFQQLYAALSVCISFPATATILLIFIPKLIHRVKASSLDDETLETTMHSTFARPSIDITSTCPGTEMGRERFVDAPPMTTLGVYQNGGYSGSLSPIPSPSPAKTNEEPVSPPKKLED